MDSFHSCGTWQLHRKLHTSVLPYVLHHLPIEAITAPRVRFRMVGEWVGLRSMLVLEASPGWHYTVDARPTKKGQTVLGPEHAWSLQEVASMERVTKTSGTSPALGALTTLPPPPTSGSLLQRGRGFQYWIPLICKIMVQAYYKIVMMKLCVQ